MDSIWIQGGKPLMGKIPISGAKNAALTLLPCALLTDEKLTLSNLPRLADVDTFGHLLNQLGVSTKVAGVKKGEYRAHDDASGEGDRLDRRALRHGPADARLDPGPWPDACPAGESTVSLPGGCAIGDRPIDLHLQALEALGAEIELAAGYVKASAPKGRLSGWRIQFPGSLGRSDRKCGHGRGPGHRPEPIVQRRPRA